MGTGCSKAVQPYDDDIAKLRTLHQSKTPSPNYTNDLQQNQQILLMTKVFSPLTVWKIGDSKF